MSQLLISIVRFHHSENVKAQLKTQFSDNIVQLLIRL